MQVVYQGHNDVLLTDHDGRRFAFRKNIPRDVPQEVFTLMKSSGDAESEYLRVVETPQPTSPAASPGLREPELRETAFADPPHVERKRKKFRRDER